VEGSLQHLLSEQDKQWKKKLNQVAKQHKNQILKVTICFCHVLLFFMAALWNRAGHYIFMLWFLSSIYLLFFLT